MADERAPLVIDNGTGYSKMGLAGNEKPQFVIPTIIAAREPRRSLRDSYDYFIGNEALERGVGGGKSGVVGAHGSMSRSVDSSYSLQYPIRHGQIASWDLMEAYWRQCFFRYLRCEPEVHPILLTEPPLNAPENRELTAEIMFETFHVPRLYIAVQAVLALVASWLDEKVTSGSKGTTGRNPLTGTVIDSGDGVTHIIPVVDGYAIGGAIRHVPIAGREITHYLQQLFRERPEIATAMDPEDTLSFSQYVKEQLGYVCTDPARELARYDADTNGKWISSISWTSPRTGKTINDLLIGHERFMGPEIFFTPELMSSSASVMNKSLPNMVDEVIQACPIDCRRSLYGNIVLSGGSTMFCEFEKRLGRDLQSLVEYRLAYTTVLEKVNTPTLTMGGGNSGTPQVNVLAHRNQRYAVWAGGSLFASMDQFPTYCTSKADYDEYGPSICRQSRVFNSLLA